MTFALSTNFALFKCKFFLLSTYSVIFGMLTLYKRLRGPQK
ncbi:hypothetical protein HMPREF1616_01547 [Escherichia coli 908658]|nr:hypothetical protein HMPREF1616_01547 [Escherichia coli 908658]